MPDIEINGPVEGLARLARRLRQAAREIDQATEVSEIQHAFSKLIEPEGDNSR